MKKMFEKVNPMHPDKVADRIAGAIVDLAYKEKKDPKIAVEVLIGHGSCTVIIESDTIVSYDSIQEAVERIAGGYIDVHLIFNKQDPILNKNQQNGFRCGDNGIFKGMPMTYEEETLTDIAADIYAGYPTDGKYIVNMPKGGDYDLIICQSNIDDNFEHHWNNVENTAPFNVKLNPLGDWTGGLNVDTGATNRKLGSDMGGAVTGGGLHGKSLCKADVSVNIYAFLKAQETGKPVELFCAIGDDTVDGIPYSEIVEIARDYIKKIGGFEKFAEWGLIRPELE
jgi:S-adenosylmethionine synthetase